MINRTHRFHGIKSLGFVYRRGQAVHSHGVSLKFILNDQRSAYRVAVVVSRKVSKSAVVRNRIRRRIYESVRAVEAGITKPYDLVFLVREAELAKVRAKNLADQVTHLFVQAGVLSASKPSATDKNHAIVGQKENTN